MDIPDIQVRLLNGEQFSLRESINKVALALDEDGCVMLKNAMDLTTIEGYFSNKEPDQFGYFAIDDDSLARCVKRELVTHKAVEAILFTAHPDDFRVTNYQPSIIRGGKREVHSLLGRPDEGELIASTPGLVAVTCTHFGGNDSQLIGINIEPGSRYGAGKVVEIEANVHDVFMCNAWLKRSVAWVRERPSTAIDAIIVSYLWEEFSRKKACVLVIYVLKLLR
ncbi:MAG: hypothetical protein M1840_002194 [Geoglossum simile]|nr:MAG: hypothetical protein M1840_002194 [Geoglossum simile]